MKKPLLRIAWAIRRCLLQPSNLALTKTGVAERAHPSVDAFRKIWRLRWLLGFVPVPSSYEGPYRQALLWRYRWVNAMASNRDVLDVPCGMGWGTSQIKSAKSITGVDCSPEAIKEARLRYGWAARFVVGSMANLEFTDASFDLVACLEGIEHVSKETGAAFLKDSKRVLRDNGILMVSSPYCPTKPHSGNPHHVHEYQPDEIKGLIRSSFDIEDITTRDVDIMRVLYITARKIA